MSEIKAPSGTVDVVAASSGDIESKYLIPGTPVIIKDGMKDWKAIKQWTIPNLVKSLGDKSVRVRQYADRQLTGPPKGGWVPMAFRDFAATLTGTTDDFYLAQVSIPDHFPELSDDLRKPEFVKRTEPTMGPNLWIGANHVEPLHTDALDGILCQIKGKKRVLLYHSKDLPNLYYPPIIVSGRDALVHFSNVAPHRPIDPVVQPKALNLKYDSFSVTLDAGDMLYIPAGWSHHVSMVDPICISVNFWYWPPLRRLLTDWNAVRFWIHIYFYMGPPPHTSYLTGRNVLAALFGTVVLGVAYKQKVLNPATLIEAGESVQDLAGSIRDSVHSLCSTITSYLPVSLTSKIGIASS